MLYGGALRLVGHNWDDFAHTHPDERFLTALLLPQIGGANSFTDDRHNFPDQQLLVLRDNDWLRSRDDLLASYRVGAIRDSFASDAAGWLVDSDNKRTFTNLQQAEQALRARAVDALLLGESENWYDAGAIHSIDSLDSRDLQDLRCKHLYPETNGAGGYFDARCSPLNPHNASHGFFVYGTLPLFLAHVASDFVRSASDAGSAIFDYQGGHLVWRGISMIFDLLTILAVYTLGRRIRGEWAGLLAALFYAAAPLAIQKAHYGTVNAATSFLVTMALYSAVAVQQHGRMRAYIFFGAFTGAAVACRINVAPLASIVVFAALFQAAPVFWAGLGSNERARLILHHALGLALAGLGAFLAFRLLNPYAFTGPGFWGLAPNLRWLENLESVNAGVSGLQDFPPNWQWLARPAFIYPLKDMLFWGMGIAFGVLGWFWLVLVRISDRAQPAHRQRLAAFAALGRGLLPVHESSDRHEHALFPAAIQRVGGAGRRLPLRMGRARPHRQAQPAERRCSDSHYWRAPDTSRWLSNLNRQSGRNGADRLRTWRAAAGRSNYEALQPLASAAFRRLRSDILDHLGPDVYQRLSTSDHAGSIRPLHL